jgi:hypothetical protein
VGNGRTSRRSRPRSRLTDPPGEKPPVTRSRKVLVVDIGGTHIKVWRPGRRRVVEIDSGRKMTAKKMVRCVLNAVQPSGYNAVAIGYPGPVLHGSPIVEPTNLSRGWVGFDYEKAFGKPTRIINDAAMQALGSYRGGRMLFLGLGTGLGSALIVDGVLRSASARLVASRCRQRYTATPSATARTRSLTHASSHSVGCNQRMTPASVVAART